MFTPVACSNSCRLASANPRRQKTGSAFSKTPSRLKFFGRPIAPLSLNEPIGAKSFLTQQRVSCIRIEPIGVLPMLNQIPQPLLQPRRLGDLLLPNRVVMAPLTRGRANNPGHVPNDLMREYYEQRATAGLIISEGIWVSEDGQGWLGAPGIYNREQVAGWKAITDAIHGKGGRIFAQLWHQGAVSHPSFFHDGRLPLAAIGDRSDADGARCEWNDDDDNSARDDAGRHSASHRRLPQRRKDR